MDGMNDGLLDREIESLLAVEPSPEFVARVRVRIAEQRAPSQWRTSWTLAMGGAAAVAIVVAIAWPSRERPSSGSELVNVPVVAQTIPPLAPSLEPAVTPAPQQATRASRPAVNPPPAAGVQLPEILVAENERRGFELLLEELSDQTRAQVVSQAASGRNTPGPAWIEVGPVVVEPLRDVSIFQGAGQ